MPDTMPCEIGVEQIAGDGAIRRPRLRLEIGMMNRVELDLYLRRRARQVANTALRKGQITRVPCTCGRPGTSMRHSDFAYPLKVEWVCNWCIRGRQPKGRAPLDGLTPSRRQLLIDMLGGELTQLKRESLATLSDIGTGLPPPPITKPIYRPAQTKRTLKRYKLTDLSVAERRIAQLSPPSQRELNS